MGFTLAARCVGTILLGFAITYVPSVEQPEWFYELHGYTFEVAFPMTQANRMLKRVRELLDASAAAGKPMTSTYR